jgi:hypothetical protein
MIGIDDSLIDSHLGIRFDLFDIDRLKRQKYYFLSTKYKLIFIKASKQILNSRVLE